VEDVLWTSPLYGQNQIQHKKLGQDSENHLPVQGLNSPYIELKVSEN